MGLTRITSTTKNVTLPNGDTVPRLETVKAVVKRENLNEGTATNASMRDWVQKLGGGNSNLVAGHVIAKVLGGSGTDKNNIVPMDKKFNNSDFKSFESEVKEKFNNVLKGKDAEAHIEVTLRYPNNNTATPNAIKYDVDFKGNGVVPFSMPAILKHLT